MDTVDFFRGNRSRTLIWNSPPVSVPWCPSGLSEVQPEGTSASVQSRRKAPRAEYKKRLIGKSGEIFFENNGCFGIQKLLVVALCAITPAVELELRMFVCRAFSDSRHGVAHRRAFVLAADNQMGTQLPQSG